MSRAAGDVRAVTVDSTQTGGWFIATFFDWIRAQLQPHIEAGERWLSYAQYFVVAAFVITAVLFILRMILRRARIRHYSR